MDSRLSDRYLHLRANVFKSTSIYNNKYYKSQLLQLFSNRLPTLAKAEICLCLPGFFREHFMFRFDSQQNKEKELSCLSKAAPTPALSQTDISPVVRIGPGAVEQCHKHSSAPTDGVQGQGNPIHRGEHEEGECKDESLMVVLPYTAVNPPKGKKRLLA